MAAKSEQLTTGEDDLVPPPNFQRMLSWQLSQVVDYTTDSKKFKKKKKRKKSTNEGSLSPVSPLSDRAAPITKQQPYNSYTITNSDGEDEVYYSAPESPYITSDSDDSMTTGSLSSLPTTITGSFDSSLMDFEKEYHNTKGSSKRSKKRQREINRLAQLDFFLPLCNLLDDKVVLDVDNLELSNFSTVPTLCEICLKKIRKSTISQEDTNLPFLITSLVSNDRRERGTVSSHIQWIEKLLGEYEMYKINQQKTNKKPPKKGDAPEPCYAYGLQGMFLSDNRHYLREEFIFGCGCHTPLPNLSFRSKHSLCHGQMDSYLLRPLLHYTNYFYPLMIDGNIGRGMVSDETSKTGLTGPQKVAIGRVNHWITSRYPLVSKEYSESLKLWPGYIHWARGNLQLAVEAFARTFDELNNPIDQAVLLNEMGRMFVHFNERRLAYKHYFKSNDIVIPAEDMPRFGRYENEIKPLLMQPSNMALQASVWDTGIIDQRSAIMARTYWDMMLKCIDETKDYNTDVWYLHVAAIESKLFVHAGQSVEVRTPDQKDQKLYDDIPSSDIILKWTQECEQLVKPHLINYPILYYHLSIVYAIQGKIVKSKRNFDNFIDMFAGFSQHNGNQQPGYQFYGHLNHGHRPHPWKNLFDLLPSSKNTFDDRIVPILPICWRVRLLHPLYPYASPPVVGSVVADHSSYSKGLNFRLTPEGYLTGDMQMDLPPLKTVLIDPYNGELCFSRKSVFNHCYYTSPTVSPELNQRYCNSTLPWPTRLYESNDCVVELSMGFKLPPSSTHQFFEKAECNYMCMLHRYHSDGTHTKIDLRKILRKERKKVLLEASKYRTDCKVTPKEAEERLEKLFSLGCDMTIKHLYDPPVNPTTPINPTTANTKTANTKTANAKTANTKKDLNAYYKRQRPFFLFLQSHMILNGKVLRLTFNLSPDTDGTDTIVFVKLSTSNDFHKPRVYVSDGYEHLWPFSDILSPYNNNNYMEHIRYTRVVQTIRRDNKNNYKKVRLTFDNEGKVVSRRLFLTDQTNRRNRLINKIDVNSHIIGERYHDLDTEDNKCVESSSIYNHKKTLQSCPMLSPVKLLSAPGLLLVECDNGLVILHPGTLERLTIEGSDDTVSPPTQDGLAHPQFYAVDPIVKIISVLDMNVLEQTHTTDHDSDDILLQAALAASLNSAEDIGRGLEEIVGHEENIVLSQDLTGNTNDDDYDREEELLLPDDVTDYGSGCIVLSVNDRLLILECLPRTQKVTVKLDLKFPGCPLDFHVLNGFGYIVTASQFPDVLRADLYWLSTKGTLLGMLPCIGINPHSLFSVFLPPRERKTQSEFLSERDTSSHDDGGVRVFFEDGVGGICCLRLKDALN